ncbi:hypothetical protein X350_06850 [Oenococcus oeni S12]|uniref:TIR domain-containing protein n=1 Tax=Oenococcus oeni TaxID=1247 RepID=UPI00050E5AEC|nr:TIR domain-containing protein [Oenococcus oeni]KGH87802.1 hypothetical protein X350_06850 [Oenococcus oeni S12]
MANKTFISYKYSEATELRDKIISALGEDGQYYLGERSNSPDLTDDNTESIRSYLKDMIYHTSVMIVIISPNMKQSNWIDWEIEYALKDIKRGDNTSHSNGVLGVIMDFPDASWFKHEHIEPDGDSANFYSDEYTYSIINNNRFNQFPKVYSCTECQPVSGLTGSYISFATEKEFFNDPNSYIENAYNKSQTLDNYQISKVENQDHVATL